jgi:hypothetical protein
MGMLNEGVADEMVVLPFVQTVAKVAGDDGDDDDDDDEWFGDEFCDISVTFFFLFFFFFQNKNLF